MIDPKDFYYDLLNLRTELEERKEHLNAILDDLGHQKDLLNTNLIQISRIITQLEDN